MPLDSIVAMMSRSVYAVGLSVAAAILAKWSQYSRGAAPVSQWTGLD